MRASSPCPGRLPWLPPPSAAEEVSKLDSGVGWARALDGSEYMPGLVGLNNMKANDYANVVLQALVRVHPIRCGQHGGRGCWGWELHAY